MANELVLALAVLFLLNKPNLLQGIQHRFLLDTDDMCEPDPDNLQGTDVPRDICNADSTDTPCCNADSTDTPCCKAGETYQRYKCSPPVTSEAILTLNDFKEGGDGGGPSKCTETYHNDSEMVVALSTGWLAYQTDRSRCNKYININLKGQSVQAIVVDECDSFRGCNKEHAYQKPCRNNVIDASTAVRAALGISGGEDVPVTWSDA